MDREQELVAWTQNKLSDNECYIKPASSDASFRSYWRVFSKSQTYIVMDAPPEHEDCRPFIKISAILENAGILVPTVLASDLENGFLLLSDLGTIQYLSKLNSGNYEEYYQDAINVLHKLQLKVTCTDIPTYSEELLSQELQLFEDWFITKHLDITINQDQKTELHNIHKILIENALEQPQVFVHRDFHSRNLMKTTSNNPGVLDFQDAVCGPVTYDLVSLLKDCYISWDIQSINRLSELFRATYNENHNQNINSETWQKWFDFMGVQRHMKAIGIFCRLHYRDNKSDYLKDINRTLCYIKSVCTNYPELTNFLQLINTISPSIENICES